MRLRANLHLGDENSTLQLYPVLQETWDHLVLKLTACVLYHRVRPMVVSSPEQSPALAGQDHAPDLLTVDLTNQVTLWLECGKTTLHKLDKACKRHRQARIVMLFAEPYEAKQMREALSREDLDRIEVWSFPEGDYAKWKSLVIEQTDIIGEADHRSMNLVINGEVFISELQQH